MLLLYYMTLSVLESFMTFSVSCDYVICDCDIYDHSMTSVTLSLYFVTCVTITCDVTSHSLSKSKIKKIKNKNQNK